MEEIGRKKTRYIGDIIVGPVFWRVTKFRFHLAFICPSLIYEHWWLPYAKVGLPFTIKPNTPKTLLSQFTLLFRVKHFLIFFSNHVFFVLFLQRFFIQFIFILFFFIKVLMLGITMQLVISARLTPQVTTIICHHMKKSIIKKKKKKENTKIWGD